MEITSLCLPVRQDPGQYSSGMINANLLGAYSMILLKKRYPDIIGARALGVSRSVGCDLSLPHECLLGWLFGNLQRIN